MSGKENNSLASPCGLYCGECLYFKEQCQGCVPSDGKPSWGKCRTYACARKKNVEHCGECPEFPCPLFLKQYSPELGPWRVFYKAGQLIYRKKIGTTAWVKEKSKRQESRPKGDRRASSSLGEKTEERENREDKRCTTHGAVSKINQEETEK